MSSYLVCEGPERAGTASADACLGAVLGVLQVGVLDGQAQEVQDALVLGAATHVLTDLSWRSNHYRVNLVVVDLGLVHFD